MNQIRSNRELTAAACPRRLAGLAGLGYRAGMLGRHHRRRTGFLLAALAAVLAVAGVPGVSGPVALAASSSVLNWTQQAPAASPLARNNAAMAYDAATGDMVLFGGCARP